MNISWSWLQDFVQVNESIEAVAHRLTLSGLEVEAISAYEQVRGNLVGVVVGKVLTAAQHPNADRLRVTTVDIGTGTPSHIVCGAPNVAADQTVLVALPGATIYPGTGEPITLKEAKIRGELSQGMICAEDELGLGSSHDGILVLDDNYPAGMPAAEALKLAGDRVLEIGVTPNRTDALSHFGVARDLGALYRVPVKAPAASTATSGPCPVTVHVADPAKCPRYTGRVVHGVKVGPSPDWLRHRLLAIGQRSINNIVDATNYVMHELGQPLHAFDLNTIGGQRIEVRTGPEGEPFTLLDGTEVKLSALDLLIADGQRALVIAGVKGGLNSGVTDATTDIFIESACFDPMTVRASKRRHELHTDSAYRFERGTDPNATLPALDRATALIIELCGGTATAVVDVSAGPFNPIEFDVEYGYLERIIGVELDRAEVNDILERLGIGVRAHDNAFTCRVPRFKADVLRPQDIAEEVLRIYGMNRVAPAPKLNASLSFRPPARAGSLDDTLADILSGAGWQEIWTNSLVSRAQTRPEEQPVPIANPLSEALDVLRTRLLPSALEVVNWNVNRQARSLRLFEISRVYRTNASTTQPFEEHRRLMLVACGADAPTSWRSPETSADLFTLRGAVELLLARIPLPASPVYSPLAADDLDLAYGFSVVIGKDAIGRFGQVRGDLTRAADVSLPVFYAELDVDALERLTDQPAPTFAELPKFPQVHRDVAMFVPEGATWASIEAAVRSANPKIIRAVTAFDVYRPKKKSGDAAEARTSYALTVTLQDPEQTLTDAAVDKVMARVMQLLEKEVGVEIRKG